MTTQTLAPNRAHENIIPRQVRAPRLPQNARLPITMNGHTYTKGYNPAPIRRRERLIETVNDIAFFECYSLTREGRDVKHHQQIALTGASECRCDCEHFQFNLAKNTPTVFSRPDELCKHLHRALSILERRRELPQQHGQHNPPCVRCGAVDADNYYTSYDATGNVPDGKICGDCAGAELPVETPEFLQRSAAEYSAHMAARTADMTDDYSDIIEL